MHGGLLAGWLRPNPVLWRVLAATAALLAAALWVPALRDIFRFALPSAAWLAAAVGLGGLVLLALEGLKRLGRYAEASASQPVGKTGHLFR